MGWKKKIERARRLHRPSLKDWECDGLYEEFPAFVKSLSQQSELYQRFTVHNVPSSTCVPAILDARTTSESEFAEQYEAKRIPAVITNIPNGGAGATKSQNDSSWPAIRNWQFDALRSDSDLRNRYFKCGEDDDGKSVRVKLKHFISYQESNHDDSPLYIFDSTYDEDKRAKKLLSDYQVPSYFRDDLFRFVSESRRPPYRWFLVGPERSGTTVHIDPLATSAWNTLIYGKKRWVLFPPHVPKRIAKGKDFVRSDEDDEAIHYFMTILPRIKRKAATVGSHGDFTDFECYEFTQNEGETVFIPHGWWHAVLNLSHTVGVTQNYCSPRNFDQVWTKTRTGRKRMAYKWLCQLDTHYPHLAERARSMNKRDGFIMKYDPEETQKREKEAEKRRSRKKERRESPRHHKKLKKRLSSYQHGDDHKSDKSRSNKESRRQSHTDQHDRLTKRSRLDEMHVSPLVSSDYTSSSL